MLFTTSCVSGWRLKAVANFCTLSSKEFLYYHAAEGITLGGKAFPSYVALTANGQMLVGEPARRQMTVNPEGTTTAFKRQRRLFEQVKAAGGRKKSDKP
jgi:molecular chaperone DnaK (HSP70)